MNELIYILAGFFSGVIAGMGMGGGTLLIPALTILAGMGQHAAQGINMLAFIPGAILALFVHKKSGRLDLKSSVPLLIGGTIGAVGGSLVALCLTADWLRRLFGGFLLILSFVQFFSGEKKYKNSMSKDGSKR
ncbi:MAG: sulfite exporter TauE/SafE family protein [Bacillota bacterium]